MKFCRGALFVVVYSSACAQPAAPPTVSIADARTLAGTPASPTPPLQTIEGVVTQLPWRRTDDFFLQDHSGGARISPSRPTHVFLGQRLRLCGQFRRHEAGDWRFFPSSSVSLGVSPPLTPRSLQLADLAAGRYSSMLVRVTATVAKTSFNPPNYSVYLGDGDGPRAYLAVGDTLPSHLADVAPGMQVTVTGILYPRIISGQPSGFQIRLGTPDDLDLGDPIIHLRRNHVLLATAALLAGPLLSAIWILTLRRAVSRRTCQVEALLEEARAAARTKSEFFDNMSHEIRSPLNGVLGMAELLCQAPLPGEQRECVEAIRASGEHLLAVLNDILDLSKAEAGKLTLHPAPVELEDTVRRSAAIFRGDASARGVALRLHFAPGLPPTVRLDPLRLRQILFNLIGNAVKFTSQGSVVISVDALPSEEPLFFLLRFSIADTGPGIPPEFASRLFERFAQANTSTSGRFGGTGLGLAISHRLVEAMGGTIEVESVPAAGSTFRFTLPASACDPSPLPATSGLTPHILVAEDNPVNQHIVLRGLQRAGCRVQIVPDGLQAVQVFDSARHNLVFLDIQMPVLNGYQAAQRIRALPHGVEVPIIALTASAVEEDRELCLQAGMNDFLLKPIDVELLHEALQRWLPKL